jgi:hypothetical protein
MPAVIETPSVTELQAMLLRVPIDKLPAVASMLAEAAGEDPEQLQALETLFAEAQAGGVATDMEEGFARRGL